MDSGELYIRLGNLLKGKPNLRDIRLDLEIQKWLADCFALVEASGDTVDTSSLRNLTDALSSAPFLMEKQTCIDSILPILYRTLAREELKAPASEQGAFIPVGQDFDVFAAITKILKEAQTNVLIIDPYLDETILTDFINSAPENVKIQLLASERKLKSGLKSAFHCWVKQYGDTRPLELRFAPNRELHDRLIIIDDHTVWDMTQSFSTFAQQAPATITRFTNPDLKIDAYKDIWEAAEETLPQK